MRPATSLVTGPLGIIDSDRILGRFRQARGQQSTAAAPAGGLVDHFINSRISQASGNAGEVVSAVLSTAAERVMGRPLLSPGERVKKFLEERR